ncbi:helicase-like transcription factor isoform X3 [Dreissena polymorpha]|uniref:helicase-like transcription factor isoform X3 n=1 Tax=Dreissena polymorpha TaxID=45954 RepID=UPI0022644E4A|nr:helicase-like transcription factor isoform X3 [Dreissena polymorpha]
MGRRWWKSQSNWGWKKKYGSSQKKAKRQRCDTFMDDLDSTLSSTEVERMLGLGTSAASTSQSMIEIDDEDFGHDDLDDETCFGTLRGNIVGLQYYAGIVNRNEMVALQREPHNPYDCNAIRVLNVVGIQVGHIKRELAKPLAFILDKGLARLEGVVPFGSKNVFSMPIDLTLWGKPEHHGEAVSKLKGCGYFLTGGSPLSSAVGASLSQGPSNGGQRIMQPCQPRRTYLTPAEVKNELDKVFENIEKGDKTSLAEPAEAIVTQLYPHQKQALNWMIVRENKAILPPFWEERDGQYFNTVLNFTTKIRPPSVCGGILADDMGLGKTLEMITLIVSNFVNNEPLARPVKGLVRQSRSERLALLKAKSLLSSGCEDVGSLPDKKPARQKDNKNFIDDETHVPRSLQELIDMSAESADTGDSGDNSTSEEEEEEPTLSEKVMTLKEDPNFSPLVAHKGRSSKGSPVACRRSSRPTRSVKRPVRYTYSSDEDYLINEETPKKKVKALAVVPTIKERMKGKALVSGTNVQKGKGKKGQNSAMAECKQQNDAKVSSDGYPVDESKADVLKTSEPPAVIGVDANVSGNAKTAMVAQIANQPATRTLVSSQGCSEAPRESNTAPADPTILRTPAPDSDTSLQLKVQDEEKTTCAKDSKIRPGTLNSRKKVTSSCDSQEIICVDSSPEVDDLPDLDQPKLTEVCYVGADEDVLPDLHNPLPSKQALLDDLATVVPRNYHEPVVQDVGEATGRTAVSGPRSTLIVCPLSVLSNWMDQLEVHVDRHVHLSIYLYYGAARVKDTNVLQHQDIVITTYSTMAADYKRSQTGRGQVSPLKKVRWLRVVLDEGHAIRNPQSQQSKAIMELEAERRWVLTGTPIQNSIKDLWSLINFLKVTPFTDQQWWRRTIERPLEKGEDSALKRVQHLMGHLALRRTKTQTVDGKPLVELPKRQVCIEHITLSQEERTVYDAMQKEGKLIVSKYFKQGTLLHHYGDVLAILMRLRQLCCHPFLVAKAAEAVKETLGELSSCDGALSEEMRMKLIGTLITVLGSGTDEECAVCLDALRSPVITHCAHVFCRPCIESVIRNERADALMNSILKLRVEDPAIKSVVVSQFTSFLNVLEHPLTANGFRFVRLNGSMNQKSRTEAIEEFSNPCAGSPTIMLLSLKAGGVGINLTAASRVFLLDPAWNPASEEQCFDRCHRLGQTRDVVITKYIVEDSVEERMLQLQEKKLHLMQGAFGQKQSAEERRQKRILDIKSLLNL